MTAVKHTPTRIVHQGNKGSKTGCGFNTKKHSSHWVDSHEKINCDKKVVKADLVWSSSVFFRKLGS
ncbi:MAG: hypothetical protein CMF18_02035 [Idiomarinaceae bacterium]|nr:hypothetical protein [Idiomarinaceae bacterium]